MVGITVIDVPNVMEQDILAKMPVQTPTMRDIFRKIQVAKTNDTTT